MTEATEGQALADDAPILEGEFKVIETPADDAGAPGEAEGEGQPTPKPKQTAEQRIAELTWHRRELERQNASLLDRIASKTAPAPEPQPEPKGDGKPDPEAFEAGIYDPNYIEALTDWKAEQAVTRHTSKASAQDAQRTAVQTFESRVKEQFPDGEPQGLKTIRDAETLPVALQEIMLASDLGPKLADHYGANPGELARLSSLTPTQQAREIALVEGRMSAPAASTPKAKTVTDAPEPTPQNRGAGGKFQVAADTNDFAAFKARYGPA